MTCTTGIGDIRFTSLLAVTIFALLLPPRLSAQVNIEALRRDDPPIGRSGSLGGDLTLRAGNVDFVQLGLGGRQDIVEDGVTTLMVGEGGIGLLRSNRFASSGLFHFRRTHRLTSWVSPEWYTQTNYDRAQLLRFRVLGGAGARTSFARGEWGTLGAGTALMLEHERLKLPEDAVHPSQTTTLRTSTFLTVKLASAGGLVVTSTTYVQPRVSRPTDLRLLENMRIASALTERFALTVSFDARYDSDPPDGLAALDATLRTGLTYTY